MMSERRSIVLVSTRRFLAEALADMFHQHQQVGSCTIAADEDELRRTARAVPDHVLLVDLDAPSIDVPLMASIVDGDGLTSRRCGFYDSFTARHAESAFTLSITVLIPLSSASDRIVEAVLTDDRGLSVTSSEGLTRRQLEQLASLTRREIEVLRLMAQGRSTKAIAHLLGVTAHTVNTHKRRTFEKLDVQSQSQAVALATGAGMVAADVS